MTELDQKLIADAKRKNRDPDDIELYIKLADTDEARSTLTDLMFIKRKAKIQKIKKEQKQLISRHI